MKPKLDLKIKKKEKKNYLDNFEIIKTLGKGSFGEVYHVRSKKTQKEYALKSIKKIFISNISKEHHIHTEKLILKFLDHPTIIKLERTFQDKKHLNFLLELVQFGDLNNFINTQGMLKRKALPVHNKKNRKSNTPLIRISKKQRHSPPRSKTSKHPSNKIPKNKNNRFRNSKSVPHTLKKHSPVPLLQKNPRRKHKTQIQNGSARNNPPSKRKLCRNSNIYGSRNDHK